MIRPIEVNDVYRAYLYKWTAINDAYGLCWFIRYVHIKATAGKLIMVIDE